jgi:PAS domain-containing protein
MSPHLSISQLTFLVGTAVAVSIVLVLLVLGFHKAFERQREGTKLQPVTPRAEDATAFGMAALQGVIASLKKQQELQERCQAAEVRAEMNLRTMETIFEETGQGVMVFDHEGFLSVANPVARALLGLDTSSRRRYPELLAPESQMTGLVRECLERGTSARQETIEYQTPRDGLISLAVSVLPLQGRNGEIEGAICLLRETRGGPTA